MDVLSLRETAHSTRNASRKSWQVSSAGRRPRGTLVSRLSLQSLKLYKKIVAGHRWITMNPYSIGVDGGER